MLEEVCCLSYINGDFFDSLPKDLQNQFLTDIGPKFTHLATELYSKQAKESIAAFDKSQKAKDGGVYVRTETELATFKEPIKQQLKDWVKEANKRGYDGQGMMDYFVELLRAEGVEVPQ